MNERKEGGNFEFTLISIKVLIETSTFRFSNFFLFSGSLVMEELAKFPFLLSHNEQISFLVLEDKRWNRKELSFYFWPLVIFT